MAYINYSAAGSVIKDGYVIIPETLETISLSWDLGNESDFRGYTLYANWENFGTTKILDEQNQTSISVNTSDLNSRNIPYNFEVFGIYIDDRRTSSIYTQYYFKKNKITSSPTYSVSRQMNFSKTNYSIAITQTKVPTNLNGDTSFTYSVSDLKIQGSIYVNIYNGQNLGANFNLTVVGTEGTPPSSGPYILLSEVRATMTGIEAYYDIDTLDCSMSISCKNRWGSITSGYATIEVYLPNIPVGASNISLSGATLVGNNYYYIPGVSAVKINFTNGYDPYGVADIWHYLMYCVKDESATSVSDSEWQTKYVTSGETLNEYVIPITNEKKKFFYKIRTQNGGSQKTVDSNVFSVALDYYNKPTVEIVNVNRQETSLSFSAIISKNSSIPDSSGHLQITSVKYLKPDGTTKASMTKADNLAPSHSKYNASLTITADDLWEMYVYVYDNVSGNTDPAYARIHISRYTPIMSFTKYGVYFGHVPTYNDRGYKLTVGGVSQFKENTHFFNGISIHNKLDLYDLYPERGDLNLNSYSDYQAALYGGRLNTDTKIRFFNQDSSTSNSYDYSADIYVNNDRLAIDYTDVKGDRVTEQFVTFNDLVTHSTSAYADNDIVKDGIKREVIVIKTGSFYYKTCTITVPFSEFTFNNATDVFTLLSGSDPNSMLVHYLNPIVYSYRKGDEQGYIRAIFRSDMLPVVTATVVSDDENLFHTLKFKQDGTAYKMPSIMVHINRLNDDHKYINAGYVNIVAQGCCELIDTTDDTIIPRSHTWYYVNPSAYVKDKYGV